jgi:hypothetical protein
MSFDIWILSNRKALISVVFYYLNKNLEVRNLLGGLRRVKGFYSSKNIAEAVIPIIIGLGIKD